MRAVDLIKKGRKKLHQWPDRYLPVEIASHDAVSSLQFGRFQREFPNLALHSFSNIPFIREQFLEKNSSGDQETPSFELFSTTISAGLASVNVMTMSLVRTTRRFRSKTMFI